MNTEISCPVLYVSDLSNALKYYIEILGFKREFIYGDPVYYAGLNKEKAILHLCKPNCCPDRIGKGSVYFFCDEVDEYYKELTEKGVEVRKELIEGSHGMRNFQITDMDGNFLAFGSKVEIRG